MIVKCFLSQVESKRVWKTNYCRKIKAINQGHTWDFVIVVLANLPHFHFLSLRTDGTLESHEILECPVCLVWQVCQCLSWKTYTCCKKQNLKSETKLHILHAFYWTTLPPWDWRTKLWWVQTACEDRRHMDSPDARERSYDNSTNGVNFTIRKVNLTFFFYCNIAWILFFNKYMIQNPVFFLYNFIISSNVHAIVLSQAAQAHVSRKSQRLIHERVTRCVTRC